MILDNETKQELVDLVKTAVNAAVEARPLSDEEVQWVRLAIKAEADRAELRKAIIEKTLIGLVWLAVVGILGLIWSGVKDHIAVH
jgi:hypothetical protein